MYEGALEQATQIRFFFPQVQVTYGTHPVELSPNHHIELRNAYIFPILFCHTGSDSTI